MGLGLGLGLGQYILGELLFGSYIPLPTQYYHTTITIIYLSHG